ncbi:orotate phosphoribosyltransferase [Actinoplanes flavus]|uniref:Orotate phosphoribosyltransferase n=1 Tax=Actinoplanes flavus TaxID=2820290 RepID=A0ABS3UGT9_9ACTN|nr:phosphoribosyltransferase family protein [Actinoplanes flavus]MBO3737998.1 orotate phosphoribosyltransferase [Actinoplanes flavus]
MTALAQRVLAVGTMNGPYVLPTGRTLDFYFDEYRVVADPALLAETGKALARLLPPRIDVIAGLELGGVPFALAVSAATGLPTALVRKVAKPYGARLQVEGQPPPGARVAMVDDVIRSGRQITIAATALRQAGSDPVTALALLIRPGNAKALLNSQGIAVAGVIDDSPVPLRLGQP